MSPHGQKEKADGFLYEQKANAEGVEVDISELSLHVARHSDGTRHDLKSYGVAEAGDASVDVC